MSDAAGPATARRRTYWTSVALLGAQVADALEYAHKQGVLHRDVKPSNLLLDAHGIVWITDFGLAKVDDQENLTGTGDLLGTLRYMPPEAFEGRADGRGDVYALGLTLYEMLALRPAFDENDRNKLLKQVMAAEPPRLRKLDPGIPRDLATIVHKAIDRDPARRYTSAGALADDLGRFLRDEPIHARQTSGAERLARWARRNPWVAGLVSAVAGLLVVIAVVSALMASRLEQARQKAVLAEREALLGQAEAYVGQAHGIRQSRRVGQRFKALEAIRDAATIGRKLGQPVEWFAQLRNEAIACLALPDFRLLHEAQGLPAGIVGLAYDGDLRRYAVSDVHGQVSVRETEDDREIVRFRPFGPDPRKVGLRLSPDGRFLWLHDEERRRTQCRKLSAGSAPVVFASDQVRGFDFSPDSRQFAAAVTSGTIDLYDLETERKTRSLPLKNPASQVAFDPSGTRLAAACGAAVELLDVRSGAVVATLPMGTESESLAWHPNGRMLAVAGRTDCHIHLWDAPSRKRVHRLEVPRAQGFNIAFHPHREVLLGTDWSSTLRWWHPQAGQQFFSCPGWLSQRAFSRDGRRFAGNTGGPFGLFEIAGEQEYQSFVRDPAHGPGIEYRPVASSDGRWLATGSDEGVAFWDARTLRPVAFLRVGQTRSNVMFTATGLRIGGRNGLFDWPIRDTPEGGVRIGPPERLLPASGVRPALAFDQSHDGRVVACALYDAGAIVLHHDGAGKTVRLLPHKDVRCIGVSPDGRWVATGSHHHAAMKVWRADTGQLERTLLPDEAGQMPRFSPDSRWLATRGGRLFSVGSWGEKPNMPKGWRAPAFSPDGKLMALAVAEKAGAIGLYEVESGRELARLEDPHQDRAEDLAFSPDGTKLLVTVHQGTRVNHAWDLRLIRERLAELGLDWDAPPYPPAGEQTSPPLSPQKVEIVGTDLVTDQAKWERHEHDLAFNPFDGVAHHTLGVERLRAGEYGDAHLHLTLAVAARPGFLPSQLALADTALRAGLFQEAIDRANEVLKQGENDAARYRRAEASQRLGRHREAIGDFTALLSRYPSDSRLYQRRADSHQALDEHTKATADRAKAVELVPNQPEVLNKAAWRLVTGPPGARDLGRGLEYAERAVQLTPTNSLYLNTLGVAQYRNAMYKEAAATLEKSLAQGKGEFAAFDLFFLAMCHARLGDLATAKQRFDGAVQWVEKQKGLPAHYAEELKQFRAEAEGVLRER
jgi:WD40 repeat protein/tetratricopeptide (TPR) repeat protein